MARPRVRVYTDYKSPFAYIANKRLFEIEQELGVELEWRPYTLRIPEFMGAVEERTPHFWRKVRYSYMDARRLANAQGLTIKGPRRVYNGFYASAGMLFAQRHGIFRPYHDTVFRKFWNHELDVDELPEVSAIVTSVGGSARDFENYVHGEARAEHDRIIDEAENLGCSGAPIASTCWLSASGTPRALPPRSAADTVNRREPTVSIVDAKQWEPDARLT
jgi:2-hydroxychromene-2-carboxylate isomerase